MGVILYTDVTGNLWRQKWQVSTLPPYWRERPFFGDEFCTFLHFSILVILMPQYFLAIFDILAEPKDCLLILGGWHVWNELIGWQHYSSSNIDLHSLHCTIAPSWNNWSTHFQCETTQDAIASYTEHAYEYDIWVRCTLYGLSMLWLVVDFPGVLLGRHKLLF